jgi:hypothetical protein
MRNLRRYHHGADPEIRMSQRPPSFVSIALGLALLLAACADHPEPARTSSVKLPEAATPPTTAKGTIVETLHGVSGGRSLLRWLEDAGSAETKAVGEGSDTR